MASLDTLRPVGFTSVLAFTAAQYRGFAFLQYEQRKQRYTQRLGSNTTYDSQKCQSKRAEKNAHVLNGSSHGS